MNKHIARSNKTLEVLISSVIQINSDLDAAIELLRYAHSPSVSSDEHKVALSFWSEACDERRDVLKEIYDLFGTSKEAYAKMLCPEHPLKNLF